MMSIRRKALLTLLTIGLLLTGCSDSDTGPTAPTVDLAPPAPPAEVYACDSCAGVKVFWSANTSDNDLAGYVVYRIAFGQTWRLTDELLTESRFMDCAPLSGYAVYAVSAVDESGNESASTRFLYNYPESTPQINQP